MEKIVNLESLFHRSKERIKDLGEVFTPDKYVEDMLDLLSKGKRNFWSSEDNVFFEPCCGHGNIVLAIYRRRLNSIYKSNFKSYSKEASFYAVANAINTIWAIDIDKENVESCRARILHATVQFLKEKNGYGSEFELIEDNEDFFVHVLSAIKWQVYENETLSSLSSDVEYELNSEKTKSSREWVKHNGHHRMEFELTWSKFYEDCERDGLVPLEFEKTMKIIKSYLNGTRKNLKDYKFVEILYRYIGYDKRIGRA